MSVRKFIISLIIVLYSFASDLDQALSTTIDLKAFNLPSPPSESLGKKLKLWATYYYTPTYVSKLTGYPLLDMQGYELGPKLTHREWCMSALEGSTSIKYEGKNIVYNFAGFGENLQVNCKKYFKYTKSGKIRFRLANGPYGDGAGETNYILFPYRTIAVDPSFIPFGSLIFIPDARGIEISLRTGKSFTHDGYFFAADKGGAIKNNQIDVFEGVEKVSGFLKFIKSKPSGTFEAYIIEDENLRQLMDDAHHKESGVIVPGEF